MSWRCARKAVLPVLIGLVSLPIAGCSRVSPPVLSIVIRVVDETGAPISGAAVETSDGQQFTTGANGEIRVTWSRPGTYAVAVSSPGRVAAAFSVSMPSDAGRTRLVTLRPMPAVPELGVLPGLPGRVVFYDDFSGYPVGSVPSDPPWRFFDGDPVATNGTITVDQDVETSGRVGNVLRVRSDYGDGAELHRPALYTVLPGGVPASRDWGEYHVAFRVRLANTIYNDGALVLLRKGDGRFYALYFLNSPSGKMSVYLRKVAGWRGQSLGAPWREDAPGVLLAQRDVDVSLERGWHTFGISLTGASIRLWYDRNLILDIRDDDPSMARGTIVLGAIGTSSTVHYDDVVVKMVD